MAKSAIAQNTVNLKINPVTVNKGQIFEVPVLVSGFTNVTSFSFTISWDTTILKFIETTNLSTNLPLPSSALYPLVVKGSLWAVWLTPDAAKTLPINSSLFSMKFKALESGSSTVKFISDPAEIAFVDNSPQQQFYPYTATDGQITILQTSSTSEQDLHQARVFPNPCNDFIQLELRGQNEETGDISILDASGRLVRRITPAKGVNYASDHTLLLNTSELSPGNYWLKYNDGSKTATVPFVRQ
jgi:hypothetical protein